MLISLRNQLKVIFISIIVVVAIGCTTEKKEQSEQSDTDTTTQAALPTPDWKTFRYENLVIHYLDSQIYTDSIDLFAKSTTGMIRTDCRFFQIPVPTDTLIVYLYTNDEQGEAMTGAQYPFVKGDTIYHWPFYHFGTTMMQYLIPKWSPVETKYPFLYNGLLKLLDASGRNFHARTFMYIDSNMFIPLHQLAVTKDINANKEWHQSAEAASFVDFIVYRYGIKALKVMYESPAPFDTTVQGLFSMSVDSLEKTWLDVVGKATGLRK